MPASFHPPSVKSLTEIDVADVSYDGSSVVIQGVVSPGSQSGWFGDEYEVHCFSFAVWRPLSEPVVERELTILRPVPPETDYWGDFPEHSIQRIRVFLSNDKIRAVFEQSLPMDVQDDELQTLSDELKKPVVVSIERFGDLVLNRSINWFEGSTDWNGTEVSITFEPDEGLDISKQLVTAETLFRDSQKWAERIDAFSLKEKLSLANDWCPDGTQPITATEFLRRMTLTSISINPAGEFEFWHNDGDMFAGHSITVYGSLSEGPTYSAIEG